MYLCDLTRDNWRSRCKESWQSGAEVGTRTGVLNPLEGSPCRLVADWERGVRSARATRLKSAAGSNQDEGERCDLSDNATDQLENLVRWMEEEEMLLR
jgi:hypothetical protein